MPAREELVVTPFIETRGTEEFDCGDKGLNEFLTTREVADYEESLAGKTYLVYEASTWALVGYFTISGDNIEIPDDWRRRTRTKSLGIKKWGSCMIGRLAVDCRYQGNGIGTMILQHIFAKQLDNCLGIRFVRLASNHDAVKWYLHEGFQFLSDKDERRAEYEDAKPRMFFDLKELQEFKGRIPTIPETES